jgi:hypothetical protein
MLDNQLPKEYAKHYSQQYLEPTWSAETRDSA